MKDSRVKRKKPRKNGLMSTVDFISTALKPRFKILTLDYTPNVDDNGVRTDFVLLKLKRSK